MHFTENTLTIMVVKIALPPLKLPLGVQIYAEPQRDMLTHQLMAGIPFRSDGL